MLCVWAFPIVIVLVKGGRLCFEPSDMASHGALCRKGAWLLEQLDPATVTFFKFAKTLAPVGPRAGKQVNGTAITLPTEMRTLPKAETRNAGIIVRRC